VIVGAVSAGHLTELGHVIALEPFSVTSKVNAYATPVGTFVKVNVVAPVIVFVK
jgi:uncharacterized membrane protein